MVDRAPDFAAQIAATDNPATTLASDGPLFAMRLALAARLEAVFPPARFHHATLPARLTAREWQRLVKRTPFVGLGWGGVKTNPDSGRLMRGEAQWTVVFVVQNAEVGARFTGDRIAPGLFGMTQVGCAALHGFTLAGDDVPGAGTVAVTDVANLYADDWGEEAHALVGLTLSIPFELIDLQALDEFLREGVAWTFDDTNTDARDDIINVRTSL